ncbi:zona occludens toxin [Cupriavidus metallidurans]|uniref:zonular occludens toxin domain-containing protein n=1 Tax=Cupriavidus metallidurans TaxID=119219 RepID=UPI00068E4380|nr:zonular occludens toxin domain-containing protein [Cupriavidus metallidurans]MDE4916995.1 zonular occludens toxin domain-containing protein [Cupriavidus metallidurans]
MFIFHEGLPRSGKSYEAMVKRIIPALQKGRKVWARLNGMDYDKIAEASGVPVERVRELLHEIPEDKVLEWATLVENDSLVILDEMQNFWPYGAARSMAQDQIKAIAEHGHRGLDIIGMGQLLSGAGGVHPNWVNRCDQKIVFEKQNGRGKDDTYRWTAYKGKHDGKKIVFVKANSGVEKYDKKFFGTYRTRVEGSDNADTYQDGRTNIMTNPVIRKWIPLFGLALVAAIVFIVYLFKGGGMEKGLVKNTKAPGSEQTVVTTVTHTPAPASAPNVAAAQPSASSTVTVGDGKPQTEAMAADYVAAISAKWRPRLSGMIFDKSRARLYVEWYDDAYRLKERLSAAQLEEMGWGVRCSAYGEHVVLSRSGVVIAVTSWPMETYGSVSQETNRGISAAAGNERSRSDS